MVHLITHSCIGGVSEEVRERRVGAGRDGGIDGEGRIREEGTKKMNKMR
jgi:hypothetical protein